MQTRAGYYHRIRREQRISVGARALCVAQPEQLCNQYEIFAYIARHHSDVERCALAQNELNRMFVLALVRGPNVFSKI